YLFAAGVGILFWLFAAFACCQNLMFIKKYGSGTIHTTVSLFFILNALVTFCNLLKIMIETGSVNPYTYLGMYQKYFINTGDYIRGISFDTSTTNALLNAFGLVYFICRKKPVATFVCMAGLLVTASNFTNLLLLFVLAWLFIFQSGRDQKSLITI